MSGGDSIQEMPAAGRQDTIHLLHAKKEHKLRAGESIRATTFGRLGSSCFHRWHCTTATLTPQSGRCDRGATENTSCSRSAPCVQICSESLS